ncbi:MAG: hypothetical protein ACRDH9_04950, partial [Actinomycetota bacterium]
CGTTVVSGAGGTAVSVRLPEDAVLNGKVGGFIDRFVDIELEGNSPMLGFVLSDNLPEGEGGRYLQAVRLGRDYYSSFFQDFATSTFDEVEPGRYLVPAGDYTLYLVGDGSPVTASIPLDGLDGAVQVGTVRPADLEFNVLSNLADPEATGQQHLYSVGFGDSHLHGGLQTMTVDIRMLLDVESSGTCWYSEQPRDEQTAFLPGCPARFSEDNAAFEVFYLPGPYPGSQLWATSTDPPTGHGLGFWRIGINPLARMAAVGFSLGFEEPPWDRPSERLITDPPGDANGLTGQQPDTRPASYDPADLRTVTLETTYDAIPVGEDGIDYVPTGLGVRFGTTGTPDAPEGGPIAVYRVDVRLDGHDVYLEGRVIHEWGQPARAVSLIQMTDGCLGGEGQCWSRSRGTATIDPARKELVVRFPLASLDAEELALLGPGNVLVYPRGGTTLSHGSLFVQAGGRRTQVEREVRLDLTVTGGDFRIGSDVPPDVPCTVGCP